MTSLKLTLGIAGALSLSIGCSSNQPLSIGAKGEPCSAGGGCNPGLVCISGLCTEPPDSATGPAGGNAGGGAGGSGGSGPAGTGGQSGLDGPTSVGFCTGAPESCAMYASDSACKLVGCYWSSSVCVGTAYSCAMFGAEYPCTLAGCSWQVGPPPDTALGGTPGVGGTIPSGGSLGTGGTPGLGGTLGAGGLGVTGGAPVRGGSVGTGGSSPGGAGGSLCSNVTPCGGDVTGTWNVASSCLNVSGNLDLSMLGIGCLSAPVVGSLQVSGTWTAKADGTYVDRTTTTGTEQIRLPPSCLVVSGTTTTCQMLGSVLLSFGYDSITCGSAPDGGCNCAATISQSGGIGLLSLDARSSGTFSTWGSMLTTDSQLSYSYCVSGNKMTWTPQSTSPTTTGTIVFQREGTPGSGGAIPTGGTRAGGAGGAGGHAGSGGVGGAGGAGGTTTFFRGPCDIYAADGGPCVAAHSMVRRLSSTYDGPLYQIRVGGSKSGTGGTTVDVRFLPDGFADGSATDIACLGTTCTISVIYDQSGLGNHLTVAPAGQAKKTPDNEANAKGIPVTVGGHNLYGLHVQAGIGYRNNKATGLATGDNAETMYMIAGTDYFNGGCCFDYGNVETNSADNGEGAMEAVYFGNCTIWGRGGGDGPWVMGDLENGLWAGDTYPYDPNQPVPADWKYVTGMVKGDAAGKNHWTIKVGSARSGVLTTPFDGKRPSTRYNPMKKEGGLVLGTAGDNSNASQGNFFEGVMTAHYSSNNADDLVQANIVAAYGQ